MQIIDGKGVANNLLTKLAKELESFTSKPGLAVVLIGDNSASLIYVNNKINACKKVGIYSKKIVIAKNASENEILKIIEELNNNTDIDGILVQLPLPKHIDANIVLSAISPKKDVDGLHPYNVGLLMQNQANIRPCTPKGIMSLLAAYNVDLIGKNAVVIGASNIVGRPMVMELLNARATVSICNSKTKNLANITRNADIIIIAVGIANMLTYDMVGDNCIVIDVGINRLDDGSLAGDVDFENVSKKAQLITPVPGGVGPMTIASLLENTITAYKNKL